LLGGPFEQKWEGVGAKVPNSIGSLLPLVCRDVSSATNGKPLGQAVAFVVGLTIVGEKCDEADERGCCKEADRNLHAHAHALIVA
jgi:hypothetical protein